MDYCIRYYLDFLINFFFGGIEISYLGYRWSIVGRNHALVRFDVSVGFVLALAARAAAATSQTIAEAFTIFTNAAIVLASTAQTDLLGTRFKRVRALFQRGPNGVLAITGNIFSRIQATDTRANTVLARFLLLKASTVEL